jgi:hypothetical protein
MSTVSRAKPCEYKTFAVQDFCGEVAVEVLEGMCGV